MRVGTEGFKGSRACKESLTWIAEVEVDVNGGFYALILRWIWAGAVGLAALGSLVSSSRCFIHYVESSVFFLLSGNARLNCLNMPTEY